MRSSLSRSAFFRGLAGREVNVDLNDVAGLPGLGHRQVSSHAYPDDGPVLSDIPLLRFRRRNVAGDEPPESILVRGAVLRVGNVRDRQAHELVSLVTDELAEVTVDGHKSAVQVDFDDSNRPILVGCRKPLLAIMQRLGRDTALDVATGEIGAQVEGSQLAITWLVLFTPVDRKHGEHLATAIEDGSRDSGNHPVGTERRSNLGELGLRAQVAHGHSRPPLQSSGTGRAIFEADDTERINDAVTEADLADHPEIALGRQQLHRPKRRVHQSGGGAQNIIEDIS